jgi:hypothetical protein
MRFKNKIPVVSSARPPKSFKRPCRRCGKTYQPKGKFQKLCADCMKERSYTVWARVYNMGRKEK